MKHLGRRGRGRRMEARRREGRGETDTKERDLWKRKKAENKLESKANPESERENQK